MKLRGLLDSLGSKLRDDAGSPEEPQQLRSATYRLEVTAGWSIDHTGKVAAIRGPRGELLQISSAAGLPDQESDLNQPSDALWEVGLQAIESLLQEPDLTPLQEPCDKKTASGFSYREVVLRTPSGTLVAGFVVRGPRGVVIATLDGAPDQHSVSAVRESINSIAFESPA